MPQQPFQPVQQNADLVKRFPRGEEATPSDFKPGDFILTHGNSFFSLLIRFGQSLRFFGEDKKYTWWSHAAMIVSEHGDLIEALDAGVRETHISRYKATDYHLVKIDDIVGNITDRNKVVTFAKWCVGQRYGWLNIISIGLSLLTGCKFSFGFDGQSICSGLVARALERTNAIFNRSPSNIMPADLAKYFSVTPPSTPDKGDKPPKLPFRQ